MSTINTPNDIATKLSELQSSKSALQRQTILFDLEANMLRALNFDGALQNGDPERHVLALEQYSYLLTRAVNLFNFFDGAQGHGIYCEEIVLDATFKCVMNMGHILNAILMRRLCKFMNMQQLQRLAQVKDMFYAHILTLERLVKDEQFVAPLQNDRTGANWLPDDVPLHFQLAFLFFDGYVVQALLFSIQQANPNAFDQVQFDKSQEALNYPALNDYKIRSFARCLVLGRPMYQGQVDLMKFYHSSAITFSVNIPEVSRCAETYTEAAAEFLEKWLKEGRYPDPLPKTKVYLERLKMVGILTGFFVAIGVVLGLIGYSVSRMRR